MLCDADSVPIWGTLKLPELFCKTLGLWKVNNKSYLSLLHYWAIRNCSFCLFLPLFCSFAVNPNLGWWGGSCKTHVWAPAWEGWLTLAGLVFFAWPCPSLCHFWNLPENPPPDLIHALVSWHVAGLFALASRPYKRHILSMLREGVILEPSNGRGVDGGGDNPRGGLQDEQLKGLWALNVHGDVLAGILVRVTSLLGQREICATVTAFEEWHAHAGHSEFTVPLAIHRECRRKESMGIVAMCPGFTCSHWCNPTKAHANSHVAAHLSCHISSIVFWVGVTNIQ